MKLDPKPNIPHMPRAANQPVLLQVGWISLYQGEVYKLDAVPTEALREGIAPIYVQIGSWEDLGEGKFGIKD